MKSLSSHSLTYILSMILKYKFIKTTFASFVLLTAGIKLCFELDGWISATIAQNYEVSDVQCSGSSSLVNLLTAKLKRPIGFRGSPLFADDRSVNPLVDSHCQIKPDTNDPQDDSYFLRVTDFSRCGILKRNDFCLDLFEPSGHGKRRKRKIADQLVIEYSPRIGQFIKRYNDSLLTTKFKENIEYTVIISGDLYDKISTNLEGSCEHFLYIAAVLGSLLIISTIMMCYLTSQLYNLSVSIPMQSKSIDDFVRDGTRKYCNVASNYTGRSTVQ